MTAVLCKYFAQPDLTCLRHGGDVVAGAAHLCEDFVQPLQGAVQVDFYPARSRGHVLSVVFCPPTLHKGHPAANIQSRSQSDQLTNLIVHIFVSS